MILPSYDLKHILLVPLVLN